MIIKEIFKRILICIVWLSLFFIIAISSLDFIFEFLPIDIKFWIFNIFEILPIDIKTWIFNNYLLLNSHINYASILVIAYILIAIIWTYLAAFPLRKKDILTIQDTPFAIIKPRLSSLGSDFIEISSIFAKSYSSTEMILYDNFFIIKWYNKFLMADYNDISQIDKDYFIFSKKGTIYKFYVYDNDIDLIKEKVKIDFIEEKSNFDILIFLIIIIFIIFFRP